MARNIEIKARLEPGQISSVRDIAIAMSSHPPKHLLQKDTFYLVKPGRLKLRELGHGPAELIAYTRNDRQGPKLSCYEIHRCEHPASLHRTLSHSLGVRGVVEKSRELILIEQTRVHLDRVSGLGEFLELEVVLNDDDLHSDGEQIAKQLLAQFNIDDEALIQGAYIDLLENQS